MLADTDATNALILHLSNANSQNRTMYKRKVLLRQRTAERRALSQVGHQIIDAAQIVPQQMLLLFGGPRDEVVAVRSLPALPTIEGPGQLTRTALQHGRDGRRAVGGRDGRRLGHEVEVEELDELELDIAGRLAGLEERGDGKKAIQVLECARVLGRLDEGAGERDDGGGLDCWAVDGLKEVEKMLYPCQQTASRVAANAKKSIKTPEVIRTFIYSSLENNDLLGGCSSKLPWIRSKV